MRVAAFFADSSVESARISASRHVRGRGMVWALAGVVLAGSLFLTVVRHEGAHALGVWLTGGKVLSVTWWPEAGNLGRLEAVPGFGAAGANLYVPLAMPYLVDAVLMALSPLVLALPIAAGVRRALYQHMLHCSALDVGVNALGAAYGWNDWVLLGAFLGGYGPMAAVAALGLTAFWLWIRFRNDRVLLQSLPFLADPPTGQEPGRARLLPSRDTVDGTAARREPRPTEPRFMERLAGAQARGLCEPECAP